MPIEEKTVDATYHAMRELLHGVVPEEQLRDKAALVFEIHRVKRERGAIILGHNYMEPALYHTVADVVGDSLELARKAAETDADPIVFCGVRFMAETAKILNPGRTVLLPAEKAGCSLAAAITAEDVRALKARYPGVPVVTYVNTYAEVKAESDVCCTSSNASAVVESLGGSRVIFLPDEYLAANTARETGRSIAFAGREPDGKLVFPAESADMIGWRGRCEVHERFTVGDVEKVRDTFPGAAVLAHPECSPEVVSASDFSGSTSAMIRHVQQSSASAYLLLTECAMGENIAAENPDKQMVRMCNLRCPHMQEITLQDTLAALCANRYVIEVPEDVRVRAKGAVDRMLEIGRGARRRLPSARSA